MALIEKESQINQNQPAATEDWPLKRKKGAIKTLIEQRELIASLVQRDIKSRYKQSVLGVAWALLTPLAMTLVYTIVFSRIVKIDTGSIPYPLFSYVALLPWTFFSQGLTMGTECLVSNFNLITKIYFPREVFPISAVLGKVVDLALGILVLIPLFVIYKVEVTWWVLMVVPVMLIQISFMLGITLIFSSINLFYRDIRHVVPLLTTLWMYMTPVIYPLDTVPARFLPIYMLNPMATIIDTYRNLVLHGQPPAWGYLGIVSILSILTLVIGYRLFKKLEPAFAETI